MNPENIVLLKGTSKGLVIQLDQNTDYDIIKEIFCKKIESSADFFDNSSSAIVFKGKTLSPSQEKELLDIISEHTKMKVAFVKSVDTEETPVENKTKQSFDTLVANELKPHNAAKFFKGNIRSGRLIEFEGSVIVIGDVNPGAEVRAGGNIIILGSLKGLAHAGCTGMQDAFVAALSMTPVQLRIADIITRFPESETMRTDKTPEYAIIEDGLIYVQPLV